MASTSSPFGKVRTVEKNPGFAGGPHEEAVSVGGGSGGESRNRGLVRVPAMRKLRMQFFDLVTTASHRLCCSVNSHSCHSQNQVLNRNGRPYLSEN